MKTGNIIIATSAPGFQTSWHDASGEIKSVIIGVMVIYTEPLQQHDPVTPTDIFAQPAGVPRGPGGTVPAAGANVGYHPDDDPHRR